MSDIEKVADKKEKSVFETLNEINVNDKVEKKKDLSYLSWAWAWGTLLSNFPDSDYKVYEDDQGRNYFTDGRTCWVKTGVTVKGKEFIEYLPVMDFRNASMKLENVTSFDVNKTIQRSLTKAIARHGLGLYIYAGEDLPESEQTNDAVPNTSASKKATVKPSAAPQPTKTALVKGSKDWDNVVKALSAKSATVEQVEIKFTVSADLKKELVKLLSSPTK